MKKKKTIFGAFLMAIAIVMGVVGNNLRGDCSVAESVFLANVEALTSSESSETVKCYCKTHWFSPNVCSANADGAYCGGNPCSDHDGNCR